MLGNLLQVVHETGQPDWYAYDITAGSPAVNGAKITGTFAKPLTLIVGDLDITAASIATTWNGVSLLPYPDATATAGEMQIIFDTDPDFAVLTPASEEEPVPVTG